MSDFPDYEAAVSKYLKRFGASTDERTDLGADIKAIVDAALSGQYVFIGDPDSEGKDPNHVCGTMGCYKLVQVQLWPKEPGDG